MVETWVVGYRSNGVVVEMWVVGFWWSWVMGWRQRRD